MLQNVGLIVRLWTDDFAVLGPIQRMVQQATKLQKELKLS